MLILPYRLVFVLFLVLIGFWNLRLTGQESGADYKMQGEYSGTIGVDGQQKKFALQVIALGDGSFTGLGFHGGLPGDGWDGSPPTRDENIAAEDDVLLFSGQQGTAMVTGGFASVKNGDGEVIGRLKRVIRISPTFGKTPKDAIVLFDGSDAEDWELNGKPGSLVDGDLLKSGTASKRRFQDHHLHVEFLTPFKPKARGQARGNSGVYLQGRYEVQVLDSFGLGGEHNECGGIYSIKKPRLNMCYPPLQWQTYDIDFHAAKFEGLKKTKDAWMTVKHNGVTIHEKVELPGKTTAAPNDEGPEPGFIYLQDHGNPVHYRNIWIREILEESEKETDGGMTDDPGAIDRQTANQIEISDSESMQYLAALPKDYESKESWPLLLFLHGAGERGDNLDRVKVHGPPKLIGQGQQYPMIVVSPQCKAGERWDAKKLSLLLDQIESQFHVDTKRVYVTGLSMGGFGTWALAAHSPERFAAIAPICGGGNVSSIPNAIGTDLPIWVFHGAKDNVIPLSMSKSLVEAFRDNGVDVKFTVYPDTNHNSWTPTYANPKLLEWLLSKSRK